MKIPPAIVYREGTIAVDAAGVTRRTRTCVRVKGAGLNNLPAADTIRFPEGAGCSLYQYSCLEETFIRFISYLLVQTMTVTIEPAVSHPDLHETIATWLWTEWGTPQNHGLYRSLVAHSLPDSIPAIYVAFADGKAVGTVGLLRTDLLSRQEFTPWMAVLYVVPAFRGQGIAAVLQSHALAEARRLGFSGIYLYTKMTGFYEKSGWIFVEPEVDDHGEAIRIYRKSL